MKLPKFRFRSRFDVQQALTNLGMSSVFDPARADLSGIASKSLFVDSLVHQAFVNVDEEGTEAAAATGMTVGVVSGYIPSAEFVADRPFIFVLYDEPTGEVLFLGRVQDPSEGK